jgi:hypothetical protein
MIDETRSVSRRPDGGLRAVRLPPFQGRGALRAVCSQSWIGVSGGIFVKIQAGLIADLETLGPKSLKDLSLNNVV